MWNAFGEDNDEAFEAWAEWSSRAPDVGDGYKECCKKWASFSKVNKPLTIGSLHFMAKEDNSTAYDKFVNSKVEWIDDTHDDECDIKILYEPHIINEADVYDRNLEYCALKAHFEKRNFKINNPTAYVELFDTELIIRSDAKERYLNLWYQQPKTTYHTNGVPTIKIVPAKFYKVWKEDTHLRVYHRLDFIPPSKNHECPRDVYNLWKGYDVSTYTTKKDMNDDVKKVLNFIKKVVCDDKDNIYEYIVNWIANLFQQPAEKPKVAICLIGNQGDGKSYFTELLANMLGSCMSYTTQNAQEYFDRFDGTARLNKMLCVFNEINFDQMGKNADTLKGYITDETIRHEKKGIDPINVALYARYIFTTNNNMPLKIEDKDRRFVVLRVSSCYNSPDHNEYWAYMQSLKTNKHLLRRLYEYFTENVNIPEHYDWKANRPLTDDYLAIRKRSISPIYMYLSQIAHTSTQETVQFTPTEFANKLNLFLMNNNFNSKMAYNPVWVSRELTDISNKLNNEGISKQVLGRNKTSFIVIQPKNLNANLIKRNYYFDEFET